MRDKNKVLQVKIQLESSNNILIQQSEDNLGKGEGNTSGRWKRKEHTKYLSFLRKYYYIMRDSGLRYHYRIFNTMAEAIGTRNSSQCKSHHQKMLLKYNNSLENLTFDSSGSDEIITIGQGQTHLKNSQVVKQGVKNFEMGQKLFMILKVDDGLLLIINEKLITEY